MDFNGVSLNSMENPLSPLAFHPNDNPAVSIVLDPLDGINFISWSHVVKHALSVKNKAPRIDGSLLVPSEDDDRVIHIA